MVSNDKVRIMISLKKYELFKLELYSRYIGVSKSDFISFLIRKCNYKNK